MYLFLYSYKDICVCVLTLVRMSSECRSRILLSDMLWRQSNIQNTYEKAVGKHIRESCPNLQTSKPPNLT